MAPTTPHHYSRLVRMATAYDTDGDPPGEQTIEFSLPEDLSTVEDERLGELLGEAEDAFDAVYGEGDGDYSDDEVAAMDHLAQAAEAIREERAAREQRAEENRQRAAEAAARFRPDDDEDEPEASDDTDDDDEPEDVDETPDLEPVDDDPEPEAEADPEPEAEVEETQEAVAASAQGPISVTLRGVRSRQSRSEPADEQPAGMSLVAAAGLGGVEAGSPISVGQAAERIVSKGRTLMRGPRTELAVGSIHKPFPDDLVVDDVENRDRLSAAIDRAVDEKRLPGGSLTASAGWCAPSETMYELAEAPETTEGLLSLPEISVNRGGIRHTLGPDFSTIFSEDSLHFHYTEYEVEGGVTKPCFFVDCPEFHDVRMDVDGICIKAGLLQSRAYPETIARYVEGAPIAHEFHRSSNYLTQMTAGSTAVSFPAGQIGATAPILTAVEIQATDYRQRHRLSDQRTLEAVFPRWTYGAIRSDLARRLGVDLINVGDARIREWFTQRGINAQFVYELDDLTGGAAARTSWPANLTFLLYLGGTWVAGTQAIIELSGVFDAALVEENVYMELFTEEGFLLLQRFHDSRAVTVPICADGGTHGGVDIDCDGTLANG